MQNVIRLGVGPVAPEDVVAVARHDARVELTVKALAAIAATRERIDELAASDERVTVRHLPERAGRGAARNAGLDIARGDHVWFVNATDRVAPGALALVAERMREADVLVVHHACVDSLRRSRPGPFKQRLEKAAKAGVRRMMKSELRFWNQEAGRVKVPI